MKRCNQCWRTLEREAFVGADGKERAKNCNDCRAKYGAWQKKTPAEKLDAMPKRERPARPRVIFQRVSGNIKTGPIPVTITEERTCPPACMFFDAGCYASYGNLGASWRNMKRAVSWEEFLAKVRALPAGTLWRHNEAGDLPGDGDCLDVDALDELVRANAGRCGFTYTHKPLRSSGTLEAVYDSNLRGFTVNVSADSIEEADRLVLRDGVRQPVVVTVAHDEVIPRHTPRGYQLVECPAQTHGKTCEECQLCAKWQRASIVVFRAHGQSKGLVRELVRRKREAA